MAGEFALVARFELGNEVIAAPGIAAAGHGDQNTTLAIWILLTACGRGLIRLARP